MIAHHLLTFVLGFACGFGSCWLIRDWFARRKEFEKLCERAAPMMRVFARNMSPTRNGQVRPPKAPIVPIGNHHLIPPPKD